MYSVFDFADYLVDMEVPFPSTKAELIELCMRYGAPEELISALSILPDDGTFYRNVDEIWPEKRSDYFHIEEE